MHFVLTVCASYLSKFHLKTLTALNAYCEIPRRANAASQST